MKNRLCDFNCGQHFYFYTADQLCEEVHDDKLYEESLDDEYYDESFYLRADIYSYGQVIAYLLTGEAPWRGRHTASVANLRQKFSERENKIMVSEELGRGPLKEIIDICREEDPKNRPEMKDLVYNYFSSKYYRKIIGNFLMGLARHLCLLQLV